jgi:glycerol uptake facilitator-like aquaporin
VIGGGDLGSLWLYLTGPFLGGLAAVPVFNLQSSSAPPAE